MVDKSAIFAALIVCVLLTGYFFGVPILIQIVWGFLRPNQPLPYLVAFSMWFLIGNVLAYFSRSK